MVYQTIVTVPTSGVPQPLAATRTVAVWVKIMAKSDNQGLGYVVGLMSSGNPGVITGGGIEVIGGGVVDLPPCSDTNFYDLAKIYVDVATNNDGFKILYARR
jgi:hypothetical protein